MSPAPLARRADALKRARDELQDLRDRRESEARDSIIESLRGAVLMEPGELRKSVRVTLIKAGVLSERSAALIPSPSEFTFRLQALLTENRKEPNSRISRAARYSVPQLDKQLDNLSARNCRLEPPSNGSALVFSCWSHTCLGGCVALHVRLQVRVTKSGWSLPSFSVEEIDDGTCGCCALADPL